VVVGYRKRSTRSVILHVVRKPPTSLDVSVFQKTRIRVSPNDHSSNRRHVLVVLANELPRVGTTDSEEARRIQGNANRA
jgi:hypothetical protein